jgi:hypothetical protein
MCIRKSLLAMAGAAIVCVLVGVSAHAWATNTNYLTFNTPVAFPGVTLPAGTYTFRMPSEADRNIVQILNRTETKSYYMGITRPVDRPRGGTELLVTVGEAPAGQARPIQAWFPLGQRQGHQFIYDR